MIVGIDELAQSNTHQATTARRLSRNAVCVLAVLNDPGSQLLSDKRARLADAHATLLEFNRVRNGGKGDVSNSRPATRERIIAGVRYRALELPPGTPPMSAAHPSIAACQTFFQRRTNQRPKESLIAQLVA